MPEYTLEIKLLSDTAFSAGAGVAGMVDSEIQYDEVGLPTLSGRAIKGLLTNACSEILYALGQNQEDRWAQAAHHLFGIHGEMLDRAGALAIGDAAVAPDLRAWLTSDFSRKKFSRQEIIDSLTDLRRQTAMNEFGAPKDNSLRTIRVLIRGITLYAPIHFGSEPTADEKALLAACVMGVKRAGLGRNRGRGKVQIQITNRPLLPNEFVARENQEKDLTMEWFALFESAIVQEAA